MVHFHRDFGRLAKGCVFRYCSIARFPAVCVCVLFFFLLCFVVSSFLVSLACPFFASVSRVLFRLLYVSFVFHHFSSSAASSS